MTEPHYYRIRPKNPGAHLFEVSLTVSEPDAAGQVFEMPAWIPGSYMIRDYARHIVQVRAESNGEAVKLAKLDKSRWIADATGGPLTVTAEIYAHDLSVRGAHLDMTHAYFNGTCMFFSVQGQESVPCRLDIVPPEAPVGDDWRVATSMRPATAEPYGFGEYAAADYAELIDHPVEIGRLSIGEFEVRGIPHVIAIRGHARVDMARLCHDVQRVCEQHMVLLGPPDDLDRYVFLVHAPGQGYGGLEHRWSSSLVCSRDSLPLRGDAEIGDDYRTFLGLVSHEYFHLWNVKRMKPEAFTPYDLSKETHTGLLWVFEGITSYYDDLALVRSGLISPASYLELLGRTMTRVGRGAGRRRQSIEESSFDAWTKFYKQDANAANAIVSYYAKGSLVALALDLKLRHETDRAGVKAVAACPRMVSSPSAARSPAWISATFSTPRFAARGSCRWRACWQRTASNCTCVPRPAVPTRAASPRTPKCRRRLGSAPCLQTAMASRHLPWFIMTAHPSAPGWRPATSRSHWTGLR
jgi:predicted metalloprotease with PDZ domain